ncbi:MAG TPA: hypothetical protein VNW04_05765 [Puia sp.]|nr:hypothetical protein [Puia sp.]
MKKTVIVLSLVFSVSACCKLPVQTIQRSSSPPEVVSLDTVLTMVDKDYTIAMASLRSPDVEICSASVTFDASTTKTVDGSLGILVFTGEYVQTWNSETTITFNLGKPKEIHQEIAPKLNNFQLALVSAVKEMTKLKEKEFFGGLKVTNFNLEVDFVVTRTGSLGLTVFDKALGLTGKFEKDITQKINLTVAVKGQCP